MAMAPEDFAHVGKLKGHSNFSIWKFQIVVLLKAADLYNVVSTEFREDEQDTNWRKKDAKAQRYIGMFDKLCSIYERDSSNNKSSLLQNFFNYKIDKVVSGLSDLQNRSMKLKSVGHTTFLTAWESTPKSGRVLINLTARLLAEEKRVKQKGPDYPECMEKQLGCKICKKDNHTEQNCYFRDRNKSTTSNMDKVAFLTKSMGGNLEGSWVFDSGCTSHMINNRDYLTNVTGIESEIITPKKNKNMCAELKENIGYQECVLKNVLSVPGLIINLILVHKITENGELKSQARRTMPDSKSKQTSDLNLWHRGIDHLNFDSMKKLATLSSGLEKLKFFTMRLLEIIHTDVCGPLDRMWHGFRYFVACLDDYTHF
ncbi:hypothetical protein PR048_023339 [Dryococelus australis]|uniref:Retrovirus-related Pol polyprotein from transposon TNT 1-94-like beta-barrel domain-containing protein n=1 Tax=Dryococelus australis TaxID=614101 RepID=A0ABQ9GTW9_9NEOP|nr:hypothetical protein PR048_023339 [Dryococelus australis]